MAVSLRWLLDQKHLALELRVGLIDAPGAIQFVQSTELTDPSPWLSGGELVLSTGLGLGPRPSRAAASQYISRLRAADVAALGFGTGLTHAEIPEHLLAAARAAGLVLLEVPLITPFAAVTKAVMARVAEQDYEHVLRASEAQIRITRSALRGGAAAIVRELAVATDTAVALLDESGVTVHPQHRTELAAIAWAAVAERTHQSGVATTSGSRSSMTISGPQEYVSIQPVGSAIAEQRYLVMASVVGHSMVDRILLGHAVSLLTFEREKSTRIRAQQNSLNSTALRLRLQAQCEHTSDADVLVRAADRRGMIAVARIRTSALESAVDGIEDYFLRAGRELFMAADGEGIVLVLRGAEAESSVRSLFETFTPALRRGIRIGLSGALGLDDLAAAMDEAKLACALASPQEPIHRYRAVGDDTVLASPDARAVLLTVASSVVPVLTNHTGTHSGTLLAALRMFLEHNGQWEPAATRLGIHRHTLRARIALIEELLDCDLSKARVRAELLLALIAVDADSTAISTAARAPSSPSPGARRRAVRSDAPGR